MGASDQHSWFHEHGPVTPTCCWCADRDRLLAENATLRATLEEARVAWDTINGAVVPPYPDTNWRAEDQERCAGMTAILGEPGDPYWKSRGGESEGTVYVNNRCPRCGAFNPRQQPHDVDGFYPPDDGESEVTDRPV